MNPRLPKISIVTACLNHGQYLEDAILSLLRQNYPNLEHIVVDGCSKDNTLEILKSYPHLRWISEPDKGQSDALNKGFRMATGDLVGWLNADEYYMPGALAAIAQSAQRHPEADVFYGDCLFVDEHGSLQRAKAAHRFDFHILLYYGCFIVTATTFFRRNIFEENLMLDTEYRVDMDYDFFVRAALAGKSFHYINRLLAAFRWLGTNASLQHEKRRRERLRVQHHRSTLKAPDAVYNALARLYTAKRIALKALHGAYLRERRVRRHISRQTLWFRSEQNWETCRRLLAQLPPYDAEGKTPSRAPLHSPGA